MKKSAYISDILFAFCVTFLPTLCFFRYLRLNLPLSVLLATLIGVLAAALPFFLLKGKNKKNNLKKRDEENKNRLFLHLALSPQQQNADFFLRCLTPEKTEASNTAETIAEKGELTCISGLYGVKIIGEKQEKDEEEIIYFPIFTIDPVSANDVAKLWSETHREGNAAKNLSLGILAKELTAEANKLCDKLGISRIAGNDFYLKAKSAHRLKDSYPYETYLKTVKKERKKLWFAKTNSKNFLTGGALILLASLITPFPYYYLISGSILIAASILVRIFGYR